jgi:AraC-like DNA-binding protein
LHRLAERPGASRLDRQSQLVEALVLLIGRHATGLRAARPERRERRAVGLVREYLWEHATENVSLEALSRYAGLSPFHLSRVFREAVGMPPHAYQTQVRVCLAKSLLGKGLPIADAAARAGFYDQAHLTRHFKRVVGLTPGQYAAG